MTDLKGTWFVVPTPFTEAGGLDLGGQRSVVDAAIRWGVDGLTVMGVTSEADELNESERESALEAIASAVAGRVPVAVGCSAPNVAVVRGRIDRARDLGAEAAMVAAPPGSEATTLPDFYRSIAEGAGLPIIVQDEPAATGVVIPVQILLSCIEAAGARVVKLEHAPTPPKISALLDADRDLLVFGGLGGVAALAELRRGACGTMTGFAFPEILAAVRRAHEAGERERAAEIFDRFLPLIQYEAMFGLPVRKELLRRRAAFARNLTRRASSVDDGVLAELEDVLARVGVTPSSDPLGVG